MSNWEGKIDINKVFVLQPTRPTTYFGVGAVEKIGGILDEMKRRGQDKVLVVTDKIAYQASGAWNAVKPALDERASAWRHYDNVRPNPTYDNCEEAAAMGADMGATCILAIGGGSAMDTAKTAAVLMTHPGKKAADFYEKGEAIGSAVPIIAINTSHGTGSSVTPSPWPSLDGEDKPAINSPHIYPTFTIEDPRLDGHHAHPADHLHGHRRPITPPRRPRPSPPALIPSAWPRRPSDWWPRICPRPSWSPRT